MYKGFSSKYTTGPAMWAHRIHCPEYQRQDSGLHYRFNNVWSRTASPQPRIYVPPFFLRSNFSLPHPVRHSDNGKWVTAHFAHVPFYTFSAGGSRLRCKLSTSARAGCKLISVYTHPIHAIFISQIVSRNIRYHFSVVSYKRLQCYTSVESCKA